MEPPIKTVFASFPRLTFRAAWRSLCRNMAAVQREEERAEAEAVVAIQEEVQVGVLEAAPEAVARQAAARQAAGAVQLRGLAPGER